MRAFEQIGFFTGLGVAIVLLAAMVLGRFSVISVRDAKLAASTVPSPRTEPEAAAPAGGTRFTLPLPLGFRRKTVDKSTVTNKNTGTEADTERVDSATARR
jgi:hypothetical protein